MIKKLTYIFSLMMIFMIFSAVAYADVQKIYDDAHIFTGEEEKKLLGLIKEYEPQLLLESIKDNSNPKTTMYVYTTNDTKYLSTERCVAKFFEEKVKKDTANAIIYFIDMDNRNTFIYLSDSIKYNFTDDMLDTVIDNSYKYLKKGEYARFVEGEIKDTGAILCGEIKPTFKNGEKIPGFPWILLIVSLGVGTAAGITGVAIVKSKYNMDSVEYEYSTQKSTNYVSAFRDDDFVRKYVTSRTIQSNNNSSSGGKSGGSSFGSIRSSNGRGRSF